MRLYFAFGSNMDVAGMGHRCPTAVAMGVGRLDNHRFVIVHPGFATVIPTPASHVEGVLWRLGTHDLAVLDAYENLPSGLYGRVEKQVRYGGRTLRALTYYVRKPKPWRPQPGYLEDCVLPAARRWGLSPGYISDIEALVVAHGSRSPWRETKPV
jgi:Gamma-glutamyl cyclotransferase, AIG2-like